MNKQRGFVDLIRVYDTAEVPGSSYPGNGKLPSLRRRICSFRYETQKTNDGRDNEPLTNTQLDRPPSH